MSLRQAAQQAILLCEWIDKAPHERGSINGMAAQVKHTLEQALAEPEKNPFGDDAERYARKLHEEREYYKALFTAPIPRTWFGLTNEEIDVGLCRSPYALQTARAWRDGVEWAQAQLKEKNA